MKRFFNVLIVAALSACSIGNDYVRPDLAAPKQYRLAETEAQAIGNVSWWDGFQDAELSRLVTSALQQNNELVSAAARVEQFYARYGAVRSDLYPQVSADLNADRSGTSENTFTRAGSRTFNDFQAGLGLSWEVDVWGRVRRASEAALADLFAQEAARRGVVLSVVTAVTVAYTDLRSLDRRLEISKATLQSRQRSFELAKSRFESGVTSELEMRQAESEVVSTQVEIPLLEQQIAELENILSVFTGAYPRSISRGRPIEELTLKGGIPVGLPSDLLSQRPDIIAAEQALISANALVGVARTEWYPRISLTSLLGVESEELSDLVDGRSKLWRIAGAASQPVFTAGRISSDIASAEAEHAAAEAAYRQTVLQAFREVENALVANRKTAETAAARAHQVEVLQRYLRLARSNYDAGQISYLEVLDAERNLFNAEVSLVEAQAAHTKSQINLFRTLGGGWVAAAADTAVGADKVGRVPR